MLDGCKRMINQRLSASVSLMRCSISTDRTSADRASLPVPSLALPPIAIARFRGRHRLSFLATTRTVPRARDEPLLSRRCSAASLAGRHRSFGSCWLQRRAEAGDRARCSIGGRRRGKDFVMSDSIRLLFRN